MSATYNEVVTNFIAREYGPLRHASKILAQHARASYRTAEGWLSGRNVPSAENLIELMAECQELSNEVNRLVAERRAERAKS